MSRIVPMAKAETNGRGWYPLARVENRRYFFPLLFPSSPFLSVSLIFFHPFPSVLSSSRFPLNFRGLYFDLAIFRRSLHTYHVHLECSSFRNTAISSDCRESRFSLLIPGQIRVTELRLHLCNLHFVLVHSTSMVIDDCAIFGGRDVPFREFRSIRDFT